MRTLEFVLLKSTTAIDYAGGGCVYYGQAERLQRLKGAIRQCGEHAVSIGTQCALAANPMWMT